jgi:xylulokinase
MNPTEKLILAIDLGTSGPKVALVSTDGEIVACDFEETSISFLPGGGAEQQPEDWWSAIVRAARRVTGGDAARARSVAAVSCTTQYSCTVPVDRDGRPLGNAISWMDTRGARDVREITRGWPSVQGYGLFKLIRWIRLTGGAPTHSGKDSIAHVLYLRRERPDIYKATYKFLEPKDYLNHRLTGRFAATFDSINLHWLTDNRDVCNIHYNHGLIELAGLERDKLPDLIHSTDILGPLLAGPAEELGVPAGIPVVGGTTDWQAAGIGSGAVRDFEGHLYVGTSSWISCYVPFKKTDLFHNVASLPSAVPGRYSVADEQECAGACLQYLRDSLVYPADDLATGPRPAEAYKLFDRAAATVPPGSERVIFLPWMYGERTPVDDHSVRGGFFNLSLKTRRECLVRAVLEGVAYNTRWLLGCVERFCGRPFDGLNFIGGGAKSDLWCQIFADVLDRPIRRVKDPLQANTRGAAFVGAVALRCLSFGDIGARVEIEKTFWPDPANRAVYDCLYREFLQCYRRNKGIFARLNPPA